MKSMQNFVESPKLIFKIFFAKMCHMSPCYEQGVRASWSQMLEQKLLDGFRWSQMSDGVRCCRIESDGVRCCYEQVGVR